jgi:thymidylate synthase (FAD)
VNEISGRYSVMKDDFYLPAPGDVAPQSDDNKQGRSAEAYGADEAAAVIGRLEAGQKRAYAEYRELVDSGLARELARVDLPLSLYTEWYWQIDLHNLFRFLSLRLDSHAQKEIRAYAEVLLDVSRKVAPAATKSFEEHLLSGVRFSGPEMEELRRRLATTDETSPEAAASKTGGLSGKALERFEEKLKTGKQL